MFVRGFEWLDEVPVFVVVAIQKLFHFQRCKMFLNKKIDTLIVI